MAFKMRNEFLYCSVMLIILCPAASGQAPWPLLLLLLLPLLLHTWLVPGGFAWRKLAFQNRPIPPGPIGWPFIGSITLMKSLAHRRLADLSMSHSADRLMGLSLGQTPVVVSSHPDTAREILCSPAFSDRPSKASARLLMFERAIGFAPSGDYWRQLRRLAATNFFSPRRIVEMEGIRVRVAETMVKEVKEEMERRGVVALRGVLQRGSLENILGCVFGDALRREEREELEVMVREGYELIGMFNLEDYFPLWGVLDFNGVGRRCRALAERVRVLVAGIIEERRRRRRTGCDEHGLKKYDFLSVLLSLPEEERLSDSDVIAVLWEMLFRGADVVAILLEWAMARMVLHPTIQAKAQQELGRATGARPINDSYAHHLRYLQAVVKEVLRLHPPGPLLSWARLATRDVHVGKYFVPAGTTAMVNMWAITHDERIWKNPDVFRPERFLEAEINVMGSDLRLAPFGSGRRVCPGRSLGLATVQLLFAKLLQEFVWIPARPVDLSERLNLSMEMKTPLVCKAVRRRFL